MDSNEATLVNISSSIGSLSDLLDNVTLQVSSNTASITNLSLQVESHQDELLNLSARVDDNSRQGTDNANSITNLTAQFDAVTAVTETHSSDIATLFDLLSALNSSLYELTAMFAAEPTESVVTTFSPLTTLSPTTEISTSASTMASAASTVVTTTSTTTLGIVDAANTDDGFVDDTVIDSLTLVLLVLVVVLAVLVAILLLACAKQAQYLKKLRSDLKKIQKKLAPDEAVMLQLEKRVTDEIEQLRTSMRKAPPQQPVGQSPQQGFSGVDEQGGTNGVLGNGQQAAFRSQQLPPPAAAHHVVPVDSRAVAREAAARQLEVALHGSLADSTAVRPSQPDSSSSDGRNVRRLDPEAQAAAEERAAAQQLRDSIKRSQQRQLQMLQRSIHRGRGR